MKSNKLFLVTILSALVSTSVFADTVATNQTQALSGSTANSASGAAVDSNIKANSVGVGNAAGDLANTQGQSTATTTSTNQGQYQGNVGYNGQYQGNTGYNGQHQGNTGYNGQDQGQKQAQSQNGANNGQDQGQALTVNGAGIGNNYSTNISHAADLSKAVGMAYAPALTTTLTETCMGSTSVGAGFSGGAFSFGTTWRDHACVRRLDAREIKSFGDIQAAKEIMCDSDLVREAFKKVGRPCADDGGTYVAVSQPTQVEAVPAPAAPAATDVKVHDDQDANAQHDADVLQKAEEARAAMRAKGF